MEFFIWVQKIWQLYWPAFVKGAGTTLLLSITGTVIGFVIGLFCGVIKTIPIAENDNVVKKVVLKVVNVVISVYVEIFRGTPMMVQAMVIFYGTATITGITLNRIVAGIVIVSINTGAYMSEIVRGGITSIDKGQFEGAQAIGMTHWQTMRCVVIPQVIRNILPATGNEFVINIKDTSVLNVISVTELFFQSKSAAGAYFKYFETFLITSVIYFILTFTVTRILRFAEKKLDGADSYELNIDEDDGALTAKEGN